LKGRVVLSLSPPAGQITKMPCPGSVCRMPTAWADVKRAVFGALMVIFFRMQGHGLFCMLAQVNSI
jgi:hypothetical protein